MASNLALTRALMAIAEKEALFTERFYAIFFERRPDTRELFGAYPLAEQEEMMRETLRSLLIFVGDADDSGDTSDSETNANARKERKEELSWLAVNLRALGDSHAEYGVTSDMYDSYRIALLECAREVVGDSFDGPAEAAFDSATREVCQLMAQSTSGSLRVCDA